MANGFIGDSRSQEKGQNFGILTPNDIADLKRQNKLSETGDFVFLERQDYSSSTVSGGLSAVSVEFSGSLDNSEYDTYLIVLHQVRQSGPYNMNIVHTMRNSDNTGGYSGALYNMCRYMAYMSLTSPTVVNSNQSSSYASQMATSLHTDDDSQATQMIWLQNMGDNDQYPTWWARTPFRSNAYSGLFSSGISMNNLENIGKTAGWRWSGYTTSTWNCIMDVYGYKESA